jgi:phthalate 3,4-dioxygenase subunit beta
MTIDQERLPDSSAEGIADLVPYRDPLHQDVHQFLVQEASILDDRRYGEWLELMAPDIVYRMAVRVTVAGEAARSTLKDMDHFSEDHYSLGKRVERLQTDYAWAESPPSRTRRFVTNILTHRVDGSDSEVVVKSYVLLFRSRGDLRPPELVSVERTDRLRRQGDTWRIARREILVDESTLRTQNLAVFL